MKIHFPGRFSLLLVLGVWSCSAVAAEMTYLWWEAEKSAETNFPKTSYFSPQNTEQAQKLSGDAWLTAERAPGTALYAVYQVQTPRAGTYNFWVRKFWKHGPFRWRFSDQKWEECPRTCSLADSVGIRPKLCANWVYLGSVKLSKGKHKFRFETTEKGPIGMDCFLLIQGTFVPRGKLKPGTKTGKADPGWFAWEPPADPMSDDCPTDLRHLNEKRAGQSGFVRRKGSGFVLGDGTPVRFLVGGNDARKDMDNAMMLRGARRTAKYGFNLVRTGLCPDFKLWEQGRTGEFDRVLERNHFLIKALRDEGVYTWFRLYWHTGNAAVFFDPDFQKKYLSYVKYVLTKKNPYTGLPIAKDPAVAMLLLQNENNLLFWTFRPKGMSPKVRQLAERGFGRWAVKKYGSVAKALKAWGPGNTPEMRHGATSKDNPEQGRLGLYEIGNLTGANWAASQRNRKRASDQLQFMVEAQKSFYANTVKMLREKFGVRNLMVCSNWKTADARVLGPLEHYSYTPGDLVAKNSYFGSGIKFHPKPKAFHAVNVGDTYTPYSSLRPPMLPTPLAIVRTGDHPYAHDEICWNRPSPYRVEWPFLIAAYGPMLGLAATSFVTHDGTSQWESTMEVWDINSPSILGQLPAVASIYRRGYVKEAGVAAEETVPLQDLYAFKGSSVYGAKGSDALWVSKIGDLEAKEDALGTKVDPLAFFVGQVKRNITADGKPKLKVIDLKPYIDRSAKIVRSLTGEVQWNYGRGIVKLDTPYAQGVCGFLSTKGQYELKDVIIESRNEYGSVLVVSLDGKPITASKRILVQAGTQDQTYGFRTSDLGQGKRRITDLGGYPMNVRRIEAALVLKHAKAGVKATVLDENGNLTKRRMKSKKVGAGRRISLPANSLYMLIQ